jgi:hypothetical protein
MSFYGQTDRRNRKLRDRAIEQERALRTLTQTAPPWQQVRFAAELLASAGSALKDRQLSFRALELTERSQTLQAEAETKLRENHLAAQPAHA